MKKRAWIDEVAVLALAAAAVFATFAVLPLSFSAAASPAKSAKAKYFEVVAAASVPESPAVSKGGTPRAAGLCEGESFALLGEKISAGLRPSPSDFAAALGLFGHIVGIVVANLHHAPDAPDLAFDPAQAVHQGAVFGIAPLFVAAAAFVGSVLLRRDSFGCRGGAVGTGCFGMLDRFVHGRDSFHYPLGVFIVYDSIVAQFVLSCK